PTITISPQALPNGVVGSAYNQTINATPAGGNYSFAVTSGNLPPGLSLNQTTGAISGAPTSNGSFNFTITATGLGSFSSNQNYTITIGSVTPNYEGYLDRADCNVILGWAADRNRLNVSINVGVYDGSTLIATAPANQLRTDISAQLGDNGLRGFSIPTPTSLKDGVAHNVSVRFETSGVNLSNSPRSITCDATPNYTGTLEQADCNVIS